MATDIQAARAAAVIAAAIAHSGQDTPPEHLIQYAGKLVSWISAPPTARMVVTLTIPGTGITLTSTDGGTMSTPATVDNTEVVIVIATEDDKNNPTADQLTWSSDDNGTLLAPSISADTKTWTGTIQGVEGTVNVTASDPSAPNVASFVAQIVIGAGATSQLAGTVTVS